MSDLTAFLAARYADAEAHARAMHERRCGTSPELVEDPLGRPMPVECECDWHIRGVLADLAARRRIVEWAVALEHRLGVDLEQTQAREPLCLLANVYAEHADFDPAWRV